MASLRGLMKALKKDEKKPQRDEKKPRNSASKKKRSANVATRRTGVDASQPKSVWKAAVKAAQDIAGYEAMLPSGLAYLGGDEWSITVQFSDVNYVAAREEHQEAILSMWAEFLNSFSSQERLEVTTLTRVMERAEVENMLHFPLQRDRFDSLRIDRNRIISQKLMSSSGNTTTEKYLTITTTAPTQEKAQNSLTRIAKTIKDSLKRVDGCEVRMLKREERLHLLSRILRPRELLTFSEKTFDSDVMQTKDYIAPNGITTSSATSPMTLHNGVGATFSKVLWVRDYPVWMTDALMTELAETRCEMVVSLHLESYDKLEGLKLVDRQIAELEMEMIAEQRKLAKQNISADMVPQKLKDALTENRDLRAELVSSNQKLFSSVMVIVVTADTLEQLEQSVATVATTVRQQSMQVESLRNMQKEGLITALPIGRRAIPMRRTLTTNAAAVIVPFTTQEVMVEGGHWYGMNVSSANVVVADRTKTNNGNGFITGTSGSGKSQFAKGEAFATYVARPNDEIIIIDPQREYAPLVEALGGQRIEMHATSTHAVNPLDLEGAMAEDGADAITTKVRFVLSLLGIMIGEGGELSIPQKNVLDKTLMGLYRTVSADPSAPMPTFRTLRDALAEIDSPAARECAEALEMYTDGSLAAFSRSTNVDVHSRVMSWDLSQLSDDLKPYVMFVLLEYLWRRVALNYRRGKRTWLYIDEFHLLFRDAETIEFFRKLYAVGRKLGLIVTGITQNIEAVLANEYARSMLANSAFLAILGQNQTDADSLCELLNFSDEQRRYFENVQPGQGLLVSGSRVVGFDSSIERSGLLYELYQTTFKDQ